MQVKGGTLAANAVPLFSVSNTASGTCYIDGGNSEVWDEEEETLFPASTVEEAASQNALEAELLTAENRPPNASVEVKLLEHV